MAKEAQRERQQLESVTDYVQQLELTNQVESDLKQALENLANKFKTWEEENKSVHGAVVDAESAKTIVNQFEISLEEAEDALRQNENDLQKALVFLINQ
mmetsp:Transcript_67262/g.101400  ORF Transcript_67262/g.101400 Transcript_67262/m.101400 type:complete len:99 (+) Transcript_67262:574-870(+)|eukprot:CAMPEP_0117005814 /NCGR_PEP_ID=MMETSP0472-20121206/6274_1 /TAXON_ID=693140 ORGANISM="Tiarina fusus, Strain LIS" /NCGR_SAMPLE_ID=MMETSP0472 /ASSEMBLY_ACC=CAM_ASM_000603 /LENGTH=98 /DNA_ID=CAMNT_0004707119 /DNA_START=609 /DNA_END=905 /DNA_ORIENTATION=+